MMWDSWDGAVGTGENGLESYGKHCRFYTEELKGQEQKGILERLI